VVQWLRCMAALAVMRSSIGLTWSFGCVWIEWIHRATTTSSLHASHQLITNTLTSTTAIYIQMTSWSIYPLSFSIPLYVSVSLCVDALLFIIPAHSALSPSQAGSHLIEQTRRLSLETDTLSITSQRRPVRPRSAPVRRPVAPRCSTVGTALTPGPDLSLGLADVRLKCLTHEK